MFIRVDVAQSDKIIVNLNGKDRNRFLLVRISLVSRQDGFVARLNESRERLFDVAVGSLSAKALEDLNRTGFRTLLKSELRDLFNHMFGETAIQEVVIHDMVIQ